MNKTFLLSIAAATLSALVLGFAIGRWTASTTEPAAGMPVPQIAAEPPVITPQPVQQPQPPEQPRVQPQPQIYIVQPYRQPPRVITPRYPQCPGGNCPK